LGGLEQFNKYALKKTVLSQETLTNLSQEIYTNNLLTQIIKIANMQETNKTALLLFHALLLILAVNLQTTFAQSNKSTSPNTLWQQNYGED